MDYRSNIKYGFIKPALDAHTMGIISAAELLRDCGYEAVMADDVIEHAMNDYAHESRRKRVVKWIVANQITRLGISYRLDQDDALNMVGYLIEELKKEKLLKTQGGQIELIFFGGLPQTCLAMEQEFGGLVNTLKGGESASETLLKMGVPADKIPQDIHEGSRYDDNLLEFGKHVIDSQEYRFDRPVERVKYPELGTMSDSLIKRVDANIGDHFAPLIRAHVGPYSSAATRVESVNEFLSWAQSLAKAGFLDILSIGTSQLTQSNFGEDWRGRPNGGGVPVNSPEEYRMIWETSRPLLVRTYAGTKDIPKLAKIHEQTLNICWHALSLWWFNKLDDRGPYDLYTSLKEHIETIRYIARIGSAFEANVPHHFAFRGADDVTYIVSEFLAAKLAKKMGIRTFVLQNMLNTPRMTWGIQDLAKSRALLKLVTDLEDERFRVVLQPRAGLDYFKPDLYEARIQLAAVTALMDDIDPHNEKSPTIIHVVSYSEASHLATPDVINESIQITQHALSKYRRMRRRGEVDDMADNSDVQERSLELYVAASKMISALESGIPNLYSAEGFYTAFAAGFLPVPYLWSEIEEFEHAKNWRTKPIKGGIKVVDSDGHIMKTKTIIGIANGHIKDAEYNLRQRMKTTSMVDFQPPTL